MMSSDFFFRDKIPVAVLGVTGEIGQKLVQLLAHHPWFEIVALYDSNDWIEQPYGKAISGLSSLPESIANMPIQLCELPLSCSLIFSTLRSQEAIAKEKLLAEAGYYVISCASYELKSDIPLIVAEVNRNQLVLIRKQHGGKGGIVANPKNAVSGLTLALKPLMEAFGLEAVQAVTLQPLYDMNAIKNQAAFLLNQEEENREIEQQVLSVLGQLQGNTIQKASFKISMQGNHILGIKENVISVSVKLKNRVNLEDIIQAWRKFGGESQRLPLPTAPYHALYYMSPESISRLVDKEMSVYLEQLCPSPVLDYKFMIFFSHMMRGIIGSMLLNAELLVTQGNIYW